MWLVNFLVCGNKPLFPLIQSKKLLLYSELGKILSGSPVQIDFFAGQETFKDYLSNGPGSRKVILQQNYYLRQVRSGPK